MNGPFNGFLNGQVNISWFVIMDSKLINKKINSSDKKFVNSAINKICFSLISQYEMATAKIGNLIQLSPFPKEISTNEESKDEIIEEVKKNKDHLTQLIFSQDHEKPIVDFIKNDIAINVIKKSVRDLLAIIKKGINFCSSCWNWFRIYESKIRKSKCSNNKKSN